MIRETLSAIGLASRHALTQQFRRQSWATNLAHVREWSFAMPHLVRVTVANSPVHQIYVGFSRNLMQNLGKDEQERQAALEMFMQTLKDNLLANMPARRPIVKWEQLQPSAEPRVLRGVRSFILRHHSDAGNLYLMSDLASRQEFEILRDEAWGEQVASQLLPGDIGRIDTIENGVMLDRVGTYLTRCEQDVELLIPGPDGEVHAANGVVLRRQKDEDGQGLLLTLDLDRRLGLDLPAGMEIEGSFGAAGRVFRFRTRCRGKAEIALDGQGSLPCVDLAMPGRFNLDQRRRYFRVEPEARLVAHVTVLEAAPDPAGQASADADVAVAQIDDLSFSGVGMHLDDGVPSGLGLGARVEVTIEGDELDDTVTITGLVRRHGIEPCGRGREVNRLGIEFVVAGLGDRQATQKIRQYVMARQRALLTSRSRETAGVTS